MTKNIYQNIINLLLDLSNHSDVNFVYFFCLTQAANSDSEKLDFLLVNSILLNCFLFEDIPETDVELEDKVDFFCVKEIKLADGLIIKMHEKGNGLFFIVSLHETISNSFFFFLFFNNVYFSDDKKIQLLYYQISEGYLKNNVNATLYYKPLHFFDLFCKFNNIEIQPLSLPHENKKSHNEFPLFLSFPNSHPKTALIYKQNLSFRDILTANFSENCFFHTSVFGLINCPDKNSNYRFDLVCNKYILDSTLNTFYFVKNYSIKNDTLIWHFVPINTFDG
jgi:hypothetical protein